MWIVKFSSKQGGGFLKEFAMRNNLLITGYPLSSSQVGKHLQINIILSFHGSEKDKKKCINQLTKNPKVKFIEKEGELVILIYKDNLSNLGLYSPDIIYFKPIILYPTGEYVFEIASWKKKSIDRLIKLAEKDRKINILKFNKKKIGGISLQRIFPELTKKQKDVLSLAIKEGYYDYPRKTDLESLSKIKELSLSTFRQHLRIAEKKVMNFNLQNYN
jgi:predicted DNA binding protein